MKLLRKYLPLLFLLPNSCSWMEDPGTDWVMIGIENAGNRPILYTWSTTRLELYPRFRCNPGMISYGDPDYSHDIAFVTIFDSKKMYDKWLNNDSTIYGLGSYDGGRYDDDILAIYCVDSEWLQANDFLVVYPCMGDTTITYYESINGNEIIGRDGYFGPQYELMKNNP